MLTDQQVETFIYQFRQDIAALKAQATATLTTLNQLQTSINSLNNAPTPSSSSSSSTNGLDTYPSGGGILHKLVTTFQAAVNFLSTVIFKGTVNFNVLTASRPLHLDSSKNVISAKIDLTADVTGVLPVVDGGIGQNALTAHNLITGNGTGGVTFVPPVLANFLLTDNGPGVDPTFQLAPAPSTIANGTYTAGASLTLGGNTGTITFAGGKIIAIQQAT